MTGHMEAYWLEQTEADVPAEDQWLSAEEMSRLAGLRLRKRRTEWRLGRWTAKRAVAACLNLPNDVRSLQDIEIRAAPCGAPEVFLFNERTGVSLSLSHRAGTALCVVGLSGLNLGCDLELVEPRDDCFVADFFTANEQTLVERAPGDERPMLATLVWSAKESALKALHVGLRVDTTLLDVSPTGADLHQGRDYSGDVSVWSPLSLRSCVPNGSGGQIFHGWWRCANMMVRAVVVHDSLVE